ncbi:MAG: glycosyltransferase [Lachnospiraceae bacterium]|nr:glycosyltransferase [Lachnospiraceae bacterium]
MRLLLYSWKANNEQLLADNLMSLGFEVLWFDKECRHFTRDMELAAAMIPCIHRESIEAVVSFNYFPIISMICDTCKIPYYAWVYDCPHFTLYAKQITLPCNHIGVFDREMVRKLQNKGVQTVYHVPLSADVERFSDVIGNAGRGETEKFRSDLSFVGSLYTDEHNYYDRVLSENDKSVLDGFIRRQCFRYDKDYLGEAMNAGELDIRVIREKMEEQGLMLGEDYFAEAEEILKAVVLEKKVTVEERRILLQNVAETFGDRYRFDLYTGSVLDDFPILRKHHRGIVDYHKQMPLVFANSRVNLNVSLRSIHSGIPHRVLDIMACGGFVMTNRQPEIMEYFEDGRELVTFGSMDECLEKITYYLEHEEERHKIASMGHRVVRERFGYREGIVRLFELED